MHRHIKPGVVIDGLIDLCVELNLNPGEVQPRECGIAGHWSYQRNVTSANVLRFAAGAGGNSVKILPYLKEGISYTASEGGPVISGPFSGCVMKGFRKDGVLNVAHVNRTSKGANARLDAQWDSFGATETADHATGTHLSDWLLPKIMIEKKYTAAEMNNFGLWVLAVPGTAGWQFYEFLVHNKAGKRMKVMKVYW